MNQDKQSEVIEPCAGSVMQSEYAQYGQRWCVRAGRYCSSATTQACVSRPSLSTPSEGVIERLRELLALVSRLLRAENKARDGSQRDAADLAYADLVSGWSVSKIDRLRRALARLSPLPLVEEGGFQARVDQWLLACFGEEIARDPVERNHRFLEEALELVQAGGCTASEAHQLVDYTFGRPVGEMGQEVGGVMNTLAALCLAHGIDMQAEGNREMDRVSTPEAMAKIRSKQAAKPKHSPLPQAAQNQAAW